VFEAVREAYGPELTHRGDGSLRVFAIGNAFEHWDAPKTMQPALGRTWRVLCAKNSFVRRSQLRR
jgi:hypothetical protein